jgi:hypothetical protein
MRVAKDGEGAVTLRSDDAAAMVDCCLMPNLAQFAEEFGQVLRLDFPSQRSGPRQIREKHRQPMTFAGGGDSGYAGLCTHRH